MSEYVYLSVLLNHSTIRGSSSVRSLNNCIKLEFSSLSCLLNGIACLPRYRTFDKSFSNSYLLSFFWFAAALFSCSAISLVLDGKSTMTIVASLSQWLLQWSLTLVNPSFQFVYPRDMQVSALETSVCVRCHS